MFCQDFCLPVMGDNLDYRAGQVATDFRPTPLTETRVDIASTLLPKVDAFMAVFNINVSEGRGDQATF